MEKLFLTPIIYIIYIYILTKQRKTMVTIMSIKTEKRISQSPGRISRFKILYYSVHYTIHRIYGIKIQNLREKEKRQHSYTFTLCYVIYVHEFKNRHESPCYNLSLAAWPALVLTGVVVHRVAGDATRLHGSSEFGTCGASGGENGESGEVVPTLDRSTADME